MERTQFISIDTYLHHPRYFFGLKKRTETREVRPATLCLLSVGQSSVDKFYCARFKNVNLKDDPSWEGRIIHPADYDHLCTTAEVYDVLCGKIPLSTTLICPDEDWEAYCKLRSFPRHGFYEPKPAIVFSEWLSDQLKDIPLTHFMDGMSSGRYEVLINPPEGTAAWQLSPWERQTIFESHPRYPRFLETDMSMERCIKMMEVYSLLKSIKRECNIA